jgi:4-methoxybenzoate monooxygenase (O-demethylating)
MDSPAIPAAMPALNFDPFSRAFLEDPFPDHARLRDAGPVACLNHYGVYAVGRHVEVRAVLQDWETFSSAAGVGLADFRREKPWRLPSLVLETDPPLHGRSRRVLSRVLAAGAVNTLRGRFHACVGMLLARLEGECVLTALAQQAGSLEITAEPTRRCNNTLRGLASLPLRIMPA